MEIIYSNTSYDDTRHIDSVNDFIGQYLVDEEINLHSLDKINDKTLKYSFIVRINGYPSHSLPTTKNFIPPIILEKIKQKFDIKILIITESESDDYNAIEVLDNYFKNLGIDRNCIWIINGNQLNHENKKLYNSELNTYVGDYILRVTAQNMNRFEHPFYLDRKYFFQCYNRVLKDHRLIILGLLEKNNLLQETDWSSLYLYQLKDRVSNEGVIYLDNQLFLSKEYQKAIQPYFNHFLKYDIKKSSSEEEYDINPQNYGPVFDLMFEHNPYQNSYVNIVNETQFERKNTIHITEKSIIPLYYHQLPIIVATPGHISKMRELYKFDMFDDIIDHSYDNETNHEKRLNLIETQILNLYKNKNKVIDFIKSNQDRFEKNRKIVIDIATNKKDEQFYKKLLNG
jgi:hypothetical protein